MTKKQWLLVGVLLVLAAVYAACFTTWFKPKAIFIHHTSRSNRPNLRPRGGVAAANVETEPVTFGFDDPVKFTEIKVVPLNEWLANHHALPLWHLVSDSNSVPLTAFVYGQGIRGMKPLVPGARPRPLELNTTYRLFVQAGSFKGEHDFQAIPKPAAGQ